MFLTLSKQSELIRQSRFEMGAIPEVYQTNISHLYSRLSTNKFVSLYWYTYIDWNYYKLVCCIQIELTQGDRNGLCCTGARKHCNWSDHFTSNSLYTRLRFGPGRTIRREIVHMTLQEVSHNNNFTLRRDPQSGTKVTEQWLPSEIANMKTL